MRFATRVYASALIAICALAASPSQAADVMVEDAWVRAAPPGMQMHAGYMVVVNKGDEDAHLVAAESPAYAAAEVHLSKIENGVATMVKQDQVTIPAHGKVTMAPGGFHVMLMHPAKPVKLGDKIPMTLRFADGSTVDVTAIVRRAGMQGQGQGHGGATNMKMKMN